MQDCNIKNVYIDKLDEIINKYNKMKPVDGEGSTYIDFDVESIDKNPKFEVDDHVRIT